MAKMNGKSVEGSVNGEIDKNSVGAVIVRHKTPILIAVIVILVTVIGMGIYSHHQDKQDQINSKLVYDFENTTLKDFQQGKIQLAAFQTAYDQLHTATDCFKGLFPLALRVADLLVEKKQLKEAAEALSHVQAELGGNLYMDYFVSIRLAAIYEDLKEEDRAITILEKLVSSSAKFMEGKLYLDLGRLYLKKGNKEKAKLNLKYVAEKATQSEFSKLAKLYLSNIEE